MKNLSVYEIQSKQMLFSEMNVSSVAWNVQHEDMIAYASNQVFFIQLKNFQPSF